MMPSPCAERCILSSEYLSSKKEMNENLGYVGITDRVGLTL